MAVKSTEVVLVLLSVVCVLLAACSCSPVSSKKPTSDDLKNSSSLREESSYVSQPTHATTTTQTELTPNHKQHSNHRYSHMKRKHGSRLLHRHAPHRFLHSLQPSDTPASHAESSLPLSSKKIQPLDLNMHMAAVTSLVDQLRYEYAQAYKADYRKEIKTVRIGGKINASSPSAVNTSLNALNWHPNQSTTGTPASADDPCALWEKCAVNQDANVSRWMKERLPSCPCQVQSSQLFYNSTIYDPKLGKYFDWRYMKVDQLAILRRTAQFCIRQRRSFRNPSLSAQVCCYDSNMTLITRGIGAGTPFLVSPDWNRQLHFRHDVLPIRLCNGDWTRYHAVRPPDNGRNCTENPDDVAYARQVAKARDY